jgi:Amt family ammonium transporter
MNPIRRYWSAFLALPSLIILSTTAWSQDEAPGEAVVPPDSGDTAWMIVATCLVLFMTLPGLALFYGGLVRSKNVLSVLVQCFVIAAVMSILWFIYGYSFATTEGSSIIGTAEKLLLKGITTDTLSGTIPESVFFVFQMTFAIITPALIVGAFAERMKFSAVLIFTSLWFTLSYLPIWHMAWGDGGLFSSWETGAMDFAGGTVVHINAGIAALVACILCGKRKGHGSKPLTPHSVPMTVIGASMLWVGWFGFNAGSELAADGVAGMAMLVTQLATAAAVLSWLALEKIISGKPTAVGAATGAVAGLVAITPASGSTSPIGAVIIGIAAGALCYFFATTVKRKFGYDDSLDVFGVHGIGGIVGAILTGVFLLAPPDGFNMGAQVFAQIKSVGITIVWSGVVSVVVLYALKATIGLRVEEGDEDRGLDTTSHGEAAYND